VEEIIIDCGKYLVWEFSIVDLLIGIENCYYQMCQDAISYVIAGCISTMTRVVNNGVLRTSH
jgi:hypothetical protein